MVAMVVRGPWWRGVARLVVLAVPVAGGAFTAVLWALAWLWLAVAAGGVLAAGLARYAPGGAG